MNYGFSSPRGTLIYGIKDTKNTQRNIRNYGNMFGKSKNLWESGFLKIVEKHCTKQFEFLELRF